jgi:molybdenum cofactor cytidylyltransferase
MLCDQPLVGTELIGQLVSAYCAKGAAIAACAYQGTLGAPALFSGPYIPRLESLPDDSGARIVIAAAGAAVHPVPFPERAVDIDTPSDYERLRDPGSFS